MASLAEFLMRNGLDPWPPRQPETAFRNPLMEVSREQFSGPFPSLPPLPPRHTIGRDHSRAELPRVQQDVAKDLAGVLVSPYALGHDTAELGHNVANSQYGPALLNALGVASAVAPVPGMKGRPPVPQSLLDKTWYHGSNRVDRVVEKGELNPKRATSGPMPFFTDNPELASTYAKNKPDTSRMRDDPGNSVSPYFTVHPRDLGHTRSRTPYTVEQSWHLLTPEQRAGIMDRWHRVGYQNRDTGEGPPILHSEPYSGLSGKEHYDWTLQREARGNPLTALRQIWHDGGNLINDEAELANIWRLAGYPHKISQSNAPWTEAMGVLPAKLLVKNPLVTTDNEAIAKVIPALEEAFKRDRTRKAAYSDSDMWDKDHRWTPREFVQQLKEDTAAGKNSYVWTSIPDKVTDALKRLGYDGILDRGGKGKDGAEHLVAIPFFPHQVRSPWAKFDPKKAHSGKILAGAAGAVAAPSLTNVLARDDQDWP
jgi:hypothetical protein